MIGNSVVNFKVTPKVERVKPLEKIFLDRMTTYSSNEVASSSEEQDIAPAQERVSEGLIDIVQELKSCEEARRKLMIAAYARVHCVYDGEPLTFWFTNRLYPQRELNALSRFGRFVPQYSDVAIRMQTGKVGTSFQYDTLNYIKRRLTHDVQLENQTNLQNQTIAIAGHGLTYQYRNISEFLSALRQNSEDIKDIVARIAELNETKKEKKTPQERARITNTIKKLEEDYRILTQQQEDLKNITIYIRKQGEMRYSHLVDPVQTRIMSQNLYDGKTVIIKGGPGTGKTTTMIHRLAYLTDTFAIREDETNKLNKYKLTPAQRRLLFKAIEEQRDWMFFSPSKMLKDYLADAMKKEGLANTSEKVWNWKDYCRVILQENYHLLESDGSNAPFKASLSTETLFYQDSDIISLFNDFYLDQLREIKTTLPTLTLEGNIYEWTAIAQHIHERLNDIDNYSLTQFVSLFNTLEAIYGNDCKRLLRERNDLLKVLAIKICTLVEENHEAKEEVEFILELTEDDLQGEPTEEDDGIAEESDESVTIAERTSNLSERQQNDSPKESEFLMPLQKWLKAYCQCKVNDDKKMTDDQVLLSEVLLPLIRNQFDDELNKLTEMAVFEQYAQYTRGVSALMLNGLPMRYKKFREYLSKTKFDGCNLQLLRDIMQRKQRKDLHHQEQSLLLGFINTLVKQIKASTATKVRHVYIDAYDEVARPIIGVDEATDFSQCDLYAMQSLLTTNFGSLTLCGDMMQRMTDYGIKSWDELDNIIVNPLPVEMTTSYRQSKKLLEVARQLFIDTQAETPRYKAFMKSSKVPAPLVFIEDNETEKIEWIAKRINEVYRAYGEKTLPSIAIFVTDKGYVPNFINRLQSTEAFAKNGFKVLDGTNAGTVPENHICIYPISVVKGMEFDVVFFHNIDKFDADQDKLKRYIYVGLSRAAFFLGVTMVEENKDVSKYFQKGKDWFKI